MRTSTTLIRRWTLAAAVAAALGFGGAQALAAPAGADTSAPPTCSQVCNAACRAIGAFGGFCPDEVSCVCYI